MPQIRFFVSVFSVLLVIRLDIISTVCTGISAKSSIIFIGDWPVLTTHVIAKLDFNLQHIWCLFDRDCVAHHLHVTVVYFHLRLR